MENSGRQKKRREIVGIRMEEIAREEERKGKNVWVGNGRIRINEEWWRWDEEEEVLKDGKGSIKIKGRGNGE